MLTVTTAGSNVAPTTVDQVLICAYFISAERLLSRPQLRVKSQSIVELLTVKGQMLSRQMQFFVSTAAEQIKFDSWCKCLAKSHKNV
jgi:hypothetical protein